MAGVNKRILDPRRRRRPERAIAVALAVMSGLALACPSSPAGEQSAGKRSNPEPAPEPAAGTPSRDADSALLIRNVHVIPMDSDRVLGDHAVLVRAGQIAWIGPTNAHQASADTTVIDGAGGYLIPGLIDMHVHIRDRDEFLLYLANGVTTVANLSGRPEHLAMRKQIRAGELLGPTMITAGPTIDGDPPRNPRFVPAGSAATATAIVAEQHAAGYDFVKIYDLIEGPAYAAAAQAARARDMAVVGHLPKPIGLRGVVGGHHLIAHAEEYFYTFFGFKADPSKLAEAARITAEAGLTVCPNTGFIRTIIEQADDIEAVLRWPELRYLPPRSKLEWLPDNNRYVGRPAEWLARNKVMYPFLLQLTKALHDRGVPLVTGTDASVAGGMPGFAIHRELADLVTAGLTPYEALRAATVNPGAWIAEHLAAKVGRPGTIVEGGVGDLVLLTGNPLDDLDVLRQPRGVVVRGQWLEHAALMAQLEGRAQRYEQAWQRFHRFRALLDAGEYQQAEAILAARGEGPAAALLSEAALNRLGYTYLRGKKNPKTAIAVFAMNVRAHPESSNVYDSLGEAFMVDGQKQRAIDNYRRSLELDPKNSNAARMLDKLAPEQGD